MMERKKGVNGSSTHIDGWIYELHDGIAFKGCWIDIGMPVRSAMLSVADYQVSYSN